MKLQLHRHEWIVLLFTLLYVGSFGAYFIYERNIEFLWYVFVVLAFFGLIIATVRTTEFSNTILWGLSIWGLLHMAGGGIRVGESVLYGKTLIPILGTGDLSILKYDQAVHFFGFAVATLVAYHILRPKLAPAARLGSVYLIVFLAGIGFGVLNEIVEFIAVLVISETGVGGYANTALDLVFNTLGAAAATLYIYMQRRNVKQNTEEKDV